MCVVIPLVCPLPPECRNWLKCIFDYINISCHFHHKALTIYKGFQANKLYEQPPFRKRTCKQAIILMIENGCTSVLCLNVTLVSLLAWPGLFERGITLSTIHGINHYPVDSVVCFDDIYLLDSDLYGG